jgi:hypothetical protein
MLTSKYFFWHPLNQFIWVEISDVNAKKMYIAICQFVPTNSMFYIKRNLDKNCPYKILEKYIYSLKNEGSIHLLGDFNAITATNQVIILNNDSNPDHLWVDEDLFLANRYNINS